MSESPECPDQEEPPHLPPKKGWGWGQWLVAAALAFLGVALVIPWFARVNEKAHMMWAESYSRQILISLKSYAGDNGGRYPDGPTSNDVFRELMKAGLLEQEVVFSCPHSPYVGDNKIGEAPDFTEALQAGENHWAMTKGLTDNSPGNWPLLFENPAVASWPPRWDSRYVNVPKPGRIWKGGVIVVCRNDGSAQLEKLAIGGERLVGLQLNSAGLDLFTLAGPHEVLDVKR